MKACTSGRDQGWGVHAERDVTHLFATCRVLFPYPSLGGPGLSLPLAHGAHEGGVGQVLLPLAHALVPWVAAAGAQQSHLVGVGQLLCQVAPACDWAA